MSLQEHRRYKVKHLGEEGRWSSGAWGEATDKRAPSFKISAIALYNLIMECAIQEPSSDNLIMPVLQRNLHLLGPASLGAMRP